VGTAQFTRILPMSPARLKSSIQASQLGRARLAPRPTSAGVSAPYPHLPQIKSLSLNSLLSTHDDSILLSHFSQRLPPPAAASRRHLPPPAAVYRLPPSDATSRHRSHLAPPRPRSASCAASHRILCGQPRPASCAASHSHIHPHRKTAGASAARASRAMASVAPPQQTTARSSAAT
jgi:hypothetical protein